MTANPARLALEKGGYGGVFFLHGDDEFRKEEYARALVEAHLDPATRDFNNDLLRGSEVDLETLASVLGTPPMMAEWRVVLVREAEALSSSSRTRDVLLRVAADPPPGLALVLMVSTDSKARFWKDLRKHARDVEFRAISDVDAPAWLVERAGETYGVVLEEDAARALASAVGTDLGILVRELEKLAGFVGEGGRITTATVERAGTRLPRQDRWKWFDLVGEKRFEEALESLPVLLGQGESGVGLVIGLGTHLLRVGVAAAGGSSALYEALGNRRWLGKQILGQARRWSAEEVEQAMGGLLRVDRLLKASGVSDEALLEEWLLGLLAREQEVAA